MNDSRARSPRQNLRWLALSGLVLLGACGPLAGEEEAGEAEAEVAQVPPLDPAQLVGRWELLEFGSPLEAVIFRSNGTFVARVFLRELREALTVNGTYRLLPNNFVELIPSPGGSSLPIRVYKAARQGGDLTLAGRGLGVDPYAYRFAPGTNCPAGQRNIRGLATTRWRSGISGVVEAPLPRATFLELNPQLTIGSVNYAGTIDAKGYLRFACVPEGDFSFTYSDARYFGTGGSVVPRIEWGNEPRGWPTGPNGEEGVAVSITGALEGPQRKMLDVMGGLSQGSRASGFLAGNLLAGVTYDPADPRYELAFVEYDPLPIPSGKAYVAARGGRRIVSLDNLTEASLNLAPSPATPVSFAFNARSAITTLAHGRPTATGEFPINTRAFMTFYAQRNPGFGNWLPYLDLELNGNRNVAQTIEVADPVPPGMRRYFMTDIRVVIALSTGHQTFVDANETRRVIDGVNTDTPPQQPRNLRVNGQLADRALRRVGARPVVSWEAPSGAPVSYYRVQVDRLDDSARFDLVTDGLAVQLPPNALTGPSVIRVVAFTCPDGSVSLCPDFSRIDEVSDFVSP